MLHFQTPHTCISVVHLAWLWTDGLLNVFVLTTAVSSQESLFPAKMPFACAREIQRSTGPSWFAITLFCCWFLIRVIFVESGTSAHTAAHQSSGIQSLVLATLYLNFSCSAKEPSFSSSKIICRCDKGSFNPLSFRSE